MGRKVKTKKNRGDVVNREFEKYSSGSESNEDGDEYESPPPAPEDLYDINPFKSDHEFSCESDVPDTEVQIVKHARTATKGGKQKRGRPPKISKMEEESEEEEEEDVEFACKKCGKSDNPEWILLCDKCDAGWHASCIRPALMVIPEGDWHCPDCQHSGLIEGLEDKLKSYAALYKSKEGEIKRRERLAFVSMSLQNIIPSSRDKFHPAKANPKATEKKSAPARKPRRKRSDDEDSSSGSEESSSSSSSSSSEEEKTPANNKRRAARNVSYNLKEYDETIKAALAEEEQVKAEYTAATRIAGKEPRTAGKEPRTAGKEPRRTIGKGMDDDDDEDEDEDDKESDTEDRKRNVKSGQGRGKDMGNHSDEDEEKEKKEKEEDKKPIIAGKQPKIAGKQPKIAGKEPRAPIEKKDKKSDDDEDPKPLKIKQHNMEDNNKKGSKKGGKKRKKLGDLSGSDDDGDSGSDFKLSGSENSAEASEDLDSAELASESEEEVPLKKRRSKKSKKSKKKKKKRGGSSEGSGSGSDYQPRKSRRARKVIFDDFVTDGDGSEPEEEKPVKKATREKTSRDSEW